MIRCSDLDNIYGISNLEEPNIFIYSIWKIWFDPYYLSGWCGDFLWFNCFFYDYAQDYRLRRWITDEEDIPDKEFHPRNFGHVYETPEGGIPHNVFRRRV